jgi:AAA+ superfamily predicted ATPase
LAALREAVRLAPDNLPLLRHFIKTLCDVTRQDEAAEFLSGLLANGKKTPAMQALLAEVFYRQGKNSHALAIVETLCDPEPVDRSIQVLYAKLLSREGQVEAAVRQYRSAIEADEFQRDSDFESLLGIHPATSRDRADSSPDRHAEVSEGRVRLGPGETRDSTVAGDLEKPSISFEQVGGMEAVKEQIRVKIIYPLTHADLFAAYGKSVGGGILLYGPPGCGKTFIARATAGEVNARFLSIGINDVLDMWMGNSERNLHELFSQARRNRPCVLFFDEVDALGASRSDLRQSSMRHLVNQFLLELDGSQASNEGLLILGATNAPWHIDSAFRRPGRFDRVLFIPPPDASARAEILKLKLATKPVVAIDFAKLAEKTADYSGADLQAVVDTAVEAKLQEAIRTGRPGPIATSDLLTALRTVKPTTREWFATARNHALYSNQGGTYDDILQYLKLR